MKKILLFTCSIVTFCFFILTNTIYSQPTLLKDIHLGPESSAIYFQFNKLGNKLLFSADDGIHGFESWLTNGTTLGTIRLNDNYEDLNDTYYYFRGGVVGQGIGKTNGTAAGTILLKDGFNRLSYLTNVNGIRFFIANIDSYNLEELWKTDGTEAGTVVVKKLRPNSVYNAYTSNLIAAPNGKDLLFTGNDGSGSALWMTDGTTAGTTKVMSFANTPQNRFGCFVNFNNEIYFTAYNSSGFGSLWKTNGTTAGTVLVYEKIQCNLAAGRIIVYKNKIYFSAQNQSPPYTYGEELWVSDGTNAGTHLFFDTNPGEAHGVPNGLQIANNLLYFITTTALNGNELWRTDGSENGTYMLKDVYPGTNSGLLNYTSYINESNKFYFTGFDGNQRMLWETDGTVSGTQSLYDISESDLPIGTYTGEINNKLIFLKETVAYGKELWSFNTTLTVNDIENTKNLKVYPNPVTNVLEIESSFTGDYQLQITNSLGQIALKQSQNVLSSTSLDVSTLSKGIYFLNITSDIGEKSTIKFVKK